MDYSVVIATKDRQGYLRRTLESLGRQTEVAPFEVIVVDNGSTDGTRGVVEARAERVPRVRYVAEPQPNRGKARNRGVELAAGRYIVFCDDDVSLPPGWLAAHAAAQTGDDCVVNGPILNVPSYAATPKPALANYSRAFLCTCNASLSREAFFRAGGFDETFDLYGWEDTELGVRLREANCRWKFAWDAFLWHIKPPAENTLEVESRKAIEKARMAGRFLGKHPSRRARLATGAHPLNLLRARYLLPDPLIAFYAGISSSGAPGWLRRLSRGQLLDALYARELLRALDAGDVR
ncbi:MAG: glycosyltransferase [Candidatus Cybelea sp.]|jgi:glycosyltransferase involved in cell wall biosynthesis